MKRNNLITGVLASACVLGGLAAMANVRELPKRIAPAADNGPQRVINDEREYGVKMFAATAVDCQHERSFVNFYSNKLYPLQKLNNLWPADGSVHSQIYMMHTGTNTPQGYFGMFAKAYTFEIVCYGWGKVDTETGEYEMLQDYYENEDIYAKSGWEGTYDMAYNYHDGKTYGIYGFVDQRDNIAKSAVGTIDLATGKITKIKELEEYYFCIAIDYDGIPYGVRWVYDIEDSVEPRATALTRFTPDWEVDDETELLIDGNSFVPAYVHTMDFDYSTGDLYWGATGTDARQKLIKIDPATAETQNLGSIGFSEVINGLYIPFETADDRQAPARVEGLKFAPSTDGSNGVTLTWTNPTKKWNREALNDLEGIEIYRDNTMTPIASIDASEIGVEMSYTDTKASAGLHTYYVAAFNDKGLGVMDEVNAFAGRDVPGQVSALKIQRNNNTKVTMSWKKPAAGARDGWYDQSTLKYRIVRMPDNVVLDEAFVPTSSTIRFVDESMQTVESYSYVITPYNEDGEGTPATTEEVILGTYVPVPYSTDYTDKNDAARWTGIDLDYAGGMTYSNCDSEGNPVYTAFTNLSAGGVNDALMSPPLNLEPGKTYKVTFDIFFNTYGKRGDNDQEYTFNILTKPYESEPVAENFTTVTTLNYTAPASYDHLKKLTFYFEAPANAADGSLNVALNCNVADVKQNWHRVEAFSIEEEFDNDMMAVDYESVLEAVVGTPSKAIVTVHNNGKNTQKNYKVQICYGRDVVLGETSKVPEVKSREDADVELTFKPVDGMDGAQDVYAVVVLTDDQNASNNRTAAKDLNILRNKVAVNHEIFEADNNTGISTGLPMKHYDISSLTQTLYPADRHGIKEKQYIHRLGWEYNANRDVKGTEITVALGMNNKLKVTGTTDWSSEREVVFKGTVDFREGNHYLVIDLDKPYLFDKNKTLVVTVLKEDAGNSGDFPIDFPTCNNSAGREYSDMPRVYSIKNLNGGSKAMSIFDVPSSSYWMPEQPKLLLALHPNAVYEPSQDGVEVVNFENAVNYNAAARSIRLIGLEGAYAAVYNVAGSLVQSVNMNGDDNFTLAVGTGVYVVRVVDTKGGVHTLKVFVK